MRERFNFVGPNISPEEEALAAHSLASLKRRENAFHEAELEKTPGERAAIELWDSFLKSEFLDLDIPEVPELRPERFHIMTGEWFEKNVSSKKRVAEYGTFTDNATFSRDRTASVFQFYKVILHEAVHSVSHQKHWVDVEKMKIYDYRTGYSVTNTAYEGDEHTHFDAFNEGVVEATVEEMFHRRGKDIQEKLSVSQDEMKEITFAYPEFRAVVSEICDGLAQHQGISSRESWIRIKKGQFTGEMMHLRAMELAYGIGALRVLDALEVSDGVQSQTGAAVQSAEERNKKILEYFRSYGENKGEKRRQPAQEILGPSVYKKYCT